MSSQCQGVQFLKVIVESILQSGTMKVPTSFVSRHWQGMPNPVILSLPNGSKSKVFWLNQDGGVWFCYGWKEFAKYSKLDVSHSIVFRYEGNSCFNVIIFGESGLEIEYPLSRDATNEEVGEIDEASYFCANLSEERSKRPREEAQEEEEEKSNRQKTCSDYSKHKNSAGTSSNGQEDFRTKLRMLREKVMPAEFAKPYLHKEGTATLFVEHGRTWKGTAFIQGYYMSSRIGLKHSLFKGRKGVSDMPSTSLKTPVTPKARTPKLRDDIFVFLKSGVLI
ncbi:hypothetical protein ACSQ67_026387 [Phaseolus vulgaris]